MTPFKMDQQYSFNAQLADGRSRQYNVSYDRASSQGVAESIARIDLEASNGSRVVSIEPDTTNKESAFAELDMVAGLIRQKEKSLPCMVMQMLHGRDGTGQDLEDWGYDGPTLNNLEFCHVTYLSHISVDQENGPLFVALTFDEDMLRLVLRQSHAEEFGMADKGAAFEFYGEPCRAYWFGDWEIQLSK